MFDLNLISDYQAPLVEMISVEVECGFAASGGNEESGMNTPGWGGL